VPTKGKWRINFYVFELMDIYFLSSILILHDLLIIFIF